MTYLRKEESRQPASGTRTEAKSVSGGVRGAYRGMKIVVGMACNRVSK